MVVVLGVVGVVEEAFAGLSAGEAARLVVTEGVEVEVLRGPTRTVSLKT